MSLYESINGLTGSQQFLTQLLMVQIGKQLLSQLDNYNALVEGVRLQLNTRADEIYESIPLFINLTEESLKTRIRLPHQIRTTTVMVDSEARVRVPAGLLEILHVRRKDDTFAISYDQYDNDSVEILAANKEEYLRVLRGQENYTRDYHSFDTAVYWWDNAYLNFAPKYAENTEIEITYSQLIPKLGTTVTVVNPDDTTIEQTVVTNEFLQIASPGATIWFLLTSKTFLTR